MLTNPRDSFKCAGSLLRMYPYNEHEFQKNNLFWEAIS
jgi:hypothetical protein